ncbi:MAG TPA: hypothetical protein VIL21_09250 [Solirubrobacterales bacterium]
MSVLARDALLERLFSPDPEKLIFVSESWDPDRVRGASYELRVAPDFLILPDGKRFWPESPDLANRALYAEFSLEPGEVAFVSSAEKLRMPWDLTGNIAPKFRLALDGLLIMGGMLVDPGYGRLRKDRGEWVECEEGERLHFQLANLGVETIHIVPEETSVAAIQFICLEGDSRREDGELLPVEKLEIPTSERLLKNFFHSHDEEPLPQLDFFAKVNQVKRRVGSLEKRAEKMEIVVAASDKAIDRVIVFGFYLVVATIIGAVCATLLSLIKG